MVPKTSKPSTAGGHRIMVYELSLAGSEAASVVEDEVVVATDP